jgi:hypothetical protein
MSLYGRPNPIWVLCVLMLYWASDIRMQAARGSLQAGFQRTELLPF